MFTHTQHLPNANTIVGRDANVHRGCPAEMVSIALDVAYGRDRSPATSDPAENMFRVNTSGRTLFAAAALLGGMTLGAGQAMAISPTKSCDSAGIGSVTLITDDQLPAQATTLSAMPAMTPASVPYCLVKVLVPQAINIWVGLPDNWNGRWESLGGSGPLFRIGIRPDFRSERRVRRRGQRRRPHTPRWQLRLRE
jgi:hypothetical protein